MLRSTKGNNFNARKEARARQVAAANKGNTRESPEGNGKETR